MKRNRPHRLEAQDAGFSVLIHGFESRWGYLLRKWLHDLRPLGKPSRSSEVKPFAFVHPVRQ